MWFDPMTKSIFTNTHSFLTEYIFILKLIVKNPIITEIADEHNLETHCSPGYLSSFWVKIGK